MPFYSAFSRRVSLWIFSLSCLSFVIAYPSPSNAESSAYGSFEIKELNSNCQVSFKHTGGRISPVFSVEMCSTTGYTALAPVEKIGTLDFPLKTPSGEEFHLFEQPHGGNACDGSTYFVAVIKDEAAWSPPSALGDCLSLEQAHLETSNGWTALVITVPPTTFFDGAIYSITLGKLDIKKLPRKARHLKKTSTITVTGILESGAHVTNFLPFVRTADNNLVVIDEEGNCDLQRVSEGKVELKASQKTFDDGSAEVTCLSLFPVK